MKKLKIFSLLLLSLLLVSCGDGKTSKKCFEFDKFSETITKYDSKCGGKIRIPDSIDDVQIKNIGSFAFQGIEITELELPKYLKKISDNAFSGLKLKELYLPESITNVWSNAFSQQEIETLKFSYNSIEIWNSAFKNSKIKNIEFYGSNNSSGYWTMKIWWEAFANNEISKLNISMNSIDFLGGWAFENNKISEIKLWEYTTKIPYNTFKNNEISNIELSKYITEIWNSAFENNKITNFSFPEEITNIWNGILNWNHIEEIILPKDLKNIPKNFLNWQKLKNLEIPEWVEIIEEWAFSNNNIETLKFPTTLKFIGKNAFENNYIANIILPKKIRIIEENAFKNNKITEVNIPNTLHNIENIFDESVKMIKNDIIENISEEVKIPEYAYLKQDYNIKIMAERRWVKDISIGEAFERCRNLSLGWYDDWRIPQIQDMRAILQYLEKNKEVEAFFDGTYIAYRLTILSFTDKYVTVFSDFSHTIDGWKWEVIFDKRWEVWFNVDSISGIEWSRNSICVRDIK